MKSTKHLTKRQIEVLEFAQSFLERNDQFPPLASIANHFGWRSVNAAQGHIDSLAIMGFVERNEVGKWRFKREAA